MEKQIWNPGTLLAPVPPVLVTCGTPEQPNVLTVGWTGILNTKPPMTYVSIRPERHSFPMIAETGEFVINLAPTSLCRAVDYCGVTSGAKQDKFAACGLTLQPSSKVACPQIAQCPVSLECRVVQTLELGSHVMFLASIECVQVGKEYVAPDGKLLVDRMDLLAYAHGSYYQLGKALGTFGFSVRKKQKQSPGRSPQPPARPEQKAAAAAFSGARKASPHREQKKAAPPPRRRSGGKEQKGKAPR